MTFDDDFNQQVLIIHLRNEGEIQMLVSNQQQKDKVMQDNLPPQSQNNQQDNNNSEQNKQQQSSIQANNRRASQSTSRRLKYKLMQAANQQFKKFFQENLQNALMCPVFLAPMVDPVIVSCGHTFERRAIVESIRVHGLKCPFSREKIDGKLTPNMKLKSLGEEYEAHLKRMKNETKLCLRQAGRLARMTIVEYEEDVTHLHIDNQKRSIDHSGKAVQMRKLVMCDLNFFYKIDLSFCQVDDDAIQLLISHALKILKNLAQLHLSNNKITVIQKIQRIPKLRLLNVTNNDLNESTKQYLKQLKEKKPRLKILF